MPSPGSCRRGRSRVLLDELRHAAVLDDDDSGLCFLVVPGQEERASRHFPWAIKSLIAWCLFCIVTGRSMPINQSTRDYFDVGDREEPAYEEKLERYRELADAHLQAAAFAEFRDSALPHLDEAVVEYIESAEFAELLVRIIRTEEQPDIQELLIERTRVLVRACAADEHAATR